MHDIQKLPYGKKWRELWLPKNINGTSLPSSVAGGHALTLTGAAKRTTCDGVHFVAGVATSNVKFADPYDAVADWWCSFRFKLDAAFSSACATDQFLIGKYVGATDYLVVRLNATDGKLYFEHAEGGAPEDVVSAETSWLANTWYHVLVSTNNTNTKRRLRIDGGTVVEETDIATAISLVANICIGARDDGVSTEGFAGVITDVIMGTATLSASEELVYYNGAIPVPGDVVNCFPMDEGRGTTAYDSGSGLDNGTLDSSCTWSYNETKIPTLGFDGINDTAITGATGDISGPITLVWAGKLGANYTPAAGGGSASVLMMGRIDDNNMVFLQSLGGTALRGAFVIDTGSDGISETDANEVGALSIVMITLTGPGVLSFYRDGVLQGATSAGGGLAVGGATWSLGHYPTVGQYDSSAPAIVGVIEAALTAQEVRGLSRFINEQMGLGLTI